MRSILHLRILFAAMVFCGAFLLFSLQPLIARFILPWFGGAPAVWTTCMFFFQALLLLGYLYAWALTARFSPRAQAMIHIGAIALALLALPIVPSDAWKPVSPDQPIARILLLLLVCVGLPYFVLSATSSLLQAWLARLLPGKSPYPLYAVSNLGSLLALVSYPFVIEPCLSRRMQAQLWGVGLCVFAVGCAACGILAWRITPPPPRSIRRPTAIRAPGARDRTLWVLFSACASMMFLAVTNKICQDIAVIPFLWIGPLSIYLISFILCFAHRSLYSRKLFMILLAGCLIMACLALPRPARFDMGTMIGIFCLTLFVCCMICHGELARLKPHPAHLTTYYLLISLGGLLGGAAVSLGAPLLFSGFFELHASLALCATLAAWTLFSEAGAEAGRIRGRWVRAGLIAAWILACQRLYAVAGQDAQRAMISRRNFYGALMVEMDSPPDAKYTTLVLRHGGVVHGLQFLNPDWAAAPTSYYSQNSGVGVALQSLLPDGPRRVGAVGLGTGTIAAYARPGDLFPIYEINPAIIELASRPFSYVTRLPETVQIVRGDARLSMETEAPQHYDLLVLDAFSGDAIPIHLLTAEAFAIYQKHLAPGGVIAVHITNDHLDLRPVVHHLASSRGLSICWIADSGAGAAFATPSSWLLLSSDPGRFDAPALSRLITPLPRGEGQMPLWTDEHASLYEIYRN